ncbi:hypothetical protein GOBAR_DD27683 [Gossypium barbadense]|nr:hypothetical protein GOBAR_DD27683 [Gossypium barbadense]
MNSIVRFKIYSACLPLHESSFRCAIENNYQKGFKFKQELNKQQVGSLLSMFRPLPAPAPGSMQPMLLQPVENQLRLTFSKDSFPQILESQKFQQTRLQQGLCHPMDPNSIIILDPLRTWAILIQLCYGTMGINQQLSTGNIYQSALQREGETVQQQDSAIQYYNPNTSHVVTHATPSVMSSMPTMGVPKVANRTLPLGYLRPFPTHH